MKLSHKILSTAIIFLTAFIFCCADSPAREGKKIADMQRIPVGDLEVVAILDAPVTFEKTIIPDAAIYPDLANAFASGPAPGVARVFYFKPVKNAQALVDAGWGNELKVKGNTGNILQANGIKPADITDILLTHMDWDHIGGLLKDGQPVYPNAAIHVARPEWEAWQSGKIGNRPDFAIERARNVAKAYNGRIKLFEFGEEIFPGVKAMAATGHTPGHTVYNVESKGEKLTIAGDIAHVEAVQLAHPEISSIYDVDPQKAAKSREELFSRVNGENGVFAGMHLPTIGKIKKNDNGGYELSPLN